MRIKTVRAARDDRALDARFERLTRSLTVLSDRHIEFVEGLKPTKPEPWKHEQII